MSTPQQPETRPREDPPGPAPTPLPEAFQTTPDTERYVLQADALRRRQLRAALLYGSSRYWRQRMRVWPGVIVGAILSALLAGGIVAADAFQTQRELNEQRQTRNQPDPLTPLTPQAPQEQRMWPGPPAP